MRTLKHRDLTICLRIQLGRAKIEIKSEIRLVPEPTILVKVKVTQLCPTLCNPIQARILEWVTFPFSRGSSQPRDQTQISCIAGRFFYHVRHQGSRRILEWVAYPSPVELPNPGIKLESPALQADSLPAELPGKPF